MQSLSSKGYERISGCFCEPGSLGLEARPIDRIAHQRMADMGEMDADLMGPASLQLAGQETCDRLAVGPRKGLEPLPMGNRVAAVLAHRHLVAGVGMAAERLVDGAAGAVRSTPHKGQVAAPHRPGA